MSVIVSQDIHMTYYLFLLKVYKSLFPMAYSSEVDEGMCSGILVSFRLEQSTTFDSQRHLGGQTGSLLQALFRRVSSVPEQEQMHTQIDISLFPITRNMPQSPTMR